jgi:holo-[acyl-carrier protein] synthase
MVKGVGIDVVETERIAHAMEKEGFLVRILTENERKQSPALGSVAGRWAAKEAIAKALGGHLGWHDVEIGNDEHGRPIVKFRREIDGRVHLSISHEKGIAAAVAIWETE